MGSTLTRFQNRHASVDEQMDEDTADPTSLHGVYSSDEDSGEPGLAMVLAYLFRTGQVNVIRPRRYGRHTGNDTEDDSDSTESLPTAVQNQSHIHPNTIKESDVWQEVLLNTGKVVPDTAKASAGNLYNISSILRQRETNSCGFTGNKNFSPGTCASISSRCIPNHMNRKLKFNEKLFCGIYSNDGETFMSACQDRYLRIYKTKRLSKDTLIKEIPARDIGWSILDTAFSSDSRYVAYSSWSNYVHVCSVYDNGDPGLLCHMAHDLQPEHYNFAVFSLQFSNDASEIICGANDGYIYMYNLERGERSLKMDAHEDDVNAVCFADSGSQIIYSGGDDGLVKVWDRRILSNTSTTPVGTFAGHQDGITYIDTKGDARYLLSNSKDQSIKLWDVRHFSSNDAVENVRQRVSSQTWDYRWEAIPSEITRKKTALRGDSSVITYTGHTVLNTLIRAHFSPMHTTGNKYVYSGCSTGRIFVYDLLTGEIVSQLKKHKDCVRDVSWHPYENEIITSSWDRGLGVWDYKAKSCIE